MTSILPTLRIDGIGAWASGLPDWAALRACARGESAPLADAPRRPAPDLLPANERRRAPDTVLLALQVALAACREAGADPATLPSVFASTHGDLAITDAMCATLAQSPTEVSPTRFHNSVHNAAAGYWTIGVGCHAAATALSAYRATLAQGLLEAAMQLADGAPRVLLVAYDGPSTGPLGTVSHSEGLLGLALVLSLADNQRRGLGLRARLLDGDPPAPAAHPLRAALGGNAMAPALELAHALATGAAECRLDAGGGRLLALQIDRHD